MDSYFVRNETESDTWRQQLFRGKRVERPHDARAERRARGEENERASGEWRWRGRTCAVRKREAGRPWWPWWARRWLASTCERKAERASRG